MSLFKDHQKITSITITDSASSRIPIAKVYKGFKADLTPQLVWQKNIQPRLRRYVLANGISGGEDTYIYSSDDLVHWIPSKNKVPPRTCITSCGDLMLAGSIDDTWLCYSTDYGSTWQSKNTSEVINGTGLKSGSRAIPHLNSAVVNGENVYVLLCNKSADTSVTTQSLAVRLNPQTITADSCVNSAIGDCVRANRALMTGGIHFSKVTTNWWTDNSQVKDIIIMCSNGGYDTKYSYDNLNSIDGRGLGGLEYSRGIFKTHDDEIFFYSRAINAEGGSAMNYLERLSKNTIKYSDSPTANYFTWTGGSFSGLYGVWRVDYMTSNDYYQPRNLMYGKDSNNNVHYVGIGAGITEDKIYYVHGEITSSPSFKEATLPSDIVGKRFLASCFDGEKFIIITEKLRDIPSPEADIYTSETGENWTKVGSCYPCSQIICT